MDEQNHFDESEVAALMTSLQAEDVIERRYAAGVVGTLGPLAYTAIPNLVVLLQDTDLEVRQRASWALSTFDDIPANIVPSLLKALNDNDSEVREWVLGALAKCSSIEPDAKSKIVPALDDSSDSVRASAASLLWRIGKESEENESEALGGLLLELLQSPDAGARTSAARLLLEMNDALETVAALASDSCYRVRIQSARALSRLAKGQEGIREKLEVMLHDENEVVQNYVAGLVTTISEKEKDEADDRN